MIATASREILQVQLDGETRSLATLPNLTGEAFQHPDDSAAGSALLSVPLFPELFAMISTGFIDQKNRMEHLTYELRLGPTQGADLYAKCVTAAKILDLPQIPEFYLNTDGSVNANSSGVHQPIVSISHGCLSQLSEGELLAVIGHELGHIKCKHSFNLALAQIFATAGASGVSEIFPIVGGAAVYGLRAALGHWSRMAEFSCDRAAMLVVQDPKVVAGTMAKLAGFSKTAVPDFNFADVYKQLDDYRMYDQNAFQSLVKLEKVFFDAIDERNTHPSPVLRIKRVLDWGESDQYKDIIAGVYTGADSAPPPDSPGPANATVCGSCGALLLHKAANFCSHCGHKV